MRKALLLLLGFAMVFSLVACGNGTTPSPSPSASAPADTPKEWVIGMNLWAANAIMMEMGDYAEFTLNTLGVKVNRVSDDLSADRMLANIQNFLSQGVDGILHMGAAAAVVPRVAEECEAAKTPFVMFNFPPPEELIDPSYNNPYFGGSAQVDWQLDGRQLAEFALSRGFKTAILVGSTFGSTTVDNRAIGFRAGFEGGGGSILDELRGDDQGTAQRVANSLSANRDVDCIFIMGSDQLPGTIAAFEVVGIDPIPSLLSGIGGAAIPHFESGVLLAGSGATHFTSFISPPLLVNMLDGHPILDNNGKPPYFGIATSIITQDTYAEYFEVFENMATAVSPDIIKSLAWRFNKDVTYQTFLDVLANEFNADALLRKK